MAIIRKTPKGPHVEFYRDKRGEHRWRAIARNGKVLADSGEGYKRIAGAKRGAISTLAVLLNMPGVMTTT
jgi:uncharacterized protein YegP (UPF0339 family)